MHTGGKSLFDDPVYKKAEQEKKQAEIEEYVKVERGKIEKKVRLLDSYMKVITTVIIFHGLICITASYVLGFLGYANALEGLSSTMASEIIAPMVTYGATKTIENVSKYNDWIEKFLFWKLGSPGGDKQLDGECAAVEGDIDIETDAIG